MTRHSDADERAINALTHHLRTNPTTRPHELAEQLLGLLRGMGWRYVPPSRPPAEGRRAAPELVHRHTAQIRAHLAALEAERHRTQRSDR